MTKVEKKAARDKRYYQKNKEKIAARRKGRYQANKAEHAQYNKKLYAKNKTKVAMQVKAWKQANPDKVTAYTKTWQRANPNKVCDISARRRARKRGAFVEDVDRAVVYERDNGRCHICGKKVPKDKWHLDHIVAITNGGEHSYRNVAVSCPHCNISKGAKAGGQPRLF